MCFPRALDPEVNHTSLVIVDGARGGKAAPRWVSPLSPEYGRIRSLLGTLGLDRRQVQVLWIKVANALQRSPTSEPPASLANSAPPPASFNTECLADTACFTDSYLYADAYRLEAQLGEILRTVKAEYPNLQMVFLSGRVYAVSQNGGLNPEPYAFESGFSVKWAIEAQIEQMRRGSIVTPFVGDLSYSNAIAPWVGWGPYLWANGTQPLTADPLSDFIGLAAHHSWSPADFELDGTHPFPPYICAGAGCQGGSDLPAAGQGEEKVGTRLRAFFKSSELTRCWFLDGQSCQ